MRRNVKTVWYKQSSSDNNCSLLHNFFVLGDTVNAIKDVSEDENQPVINGAVPIRDLTPERRNHKTEIHDDGKVIPILL